VAVPLPWFTVKAETAFFTSPLDEFDDYTLYVIEIERQTGEWVLTGGYAGEAASTPLSPLTFDPERGIARSILGRASYTVDPQRTVTIEGAVRQNGDAQYVKGEFSQGLGFALAHDVHRRGARGRSQRLPGAVQPQLARVGRTPVQLLMARPLRIISVVGARPNFMKVAPIVAELRKAPDRFSSTIVHTGQHYDDKLSRVFFEDLGMPTPDVNLNVGSASHAQQTAAVMAAFEPVVLERQPDVVLVVGDVNSTIACALVAAKLNVTVAHVEAGLRSFDRTMPEEVNRVLTDQISDLLFTSEPAGEENLLKEGVAAGKIHFVGNVMIDTLLAHRDRATALGVPASLGLTRGGYGLLTLHRPSNVDTPEVFERLLSAVASIANEMPVIFPVHPRTRARVTGSPTAARLIAGDRLRLTEPLGYLEFIGLVEASRLVLTDSGGIQEETTILRVPCLTLRDNTERPITVSHGTNQVVGTDPDRIVEAWARKRTATPPLEPPPNWDGRAAERIVAVLRNIAGDRE
jgi:UDP-N-acetylglucosamine 2-epimerase (non-hydrolysing)